MTKISFCNPAAYATRWANQRNQECSAPGFAALRISGELQPQRLAVRHCRRVGRWAAEDVPGPVVDVLVVDEHRDARHWLFTLLPKR